MCLCKCIKWKCDSSSALPAICLAAWHDSISPKYADIRMISEAVWWQLLSLKVYVTFRDLKLLRLPSTEKKDRRRETSQKPDNNHFAVTVNRSCKTAMCICGFPLGSIWNPHPGLAGRCACPNLSHQIEVSWFPRLSFDGNADDKWRFTICLFFIWKKKQQPQQTKLLGRCADLSSVFLFFSFFYFHGY